MPSLFIGGFHRRGQLLRSNTRNCCAVEHVVYVFFNNVYHSMHTYKVKMKVADSLPTLFLFFLTGTCGSPFSGGGGAQNLGFGGRQRGLQACETKKEQWAPGADTA